MLFLAVFCGMLAEYRLELIIEHQREKKYIHSLIKEIELDIASLERNYEIKKQHINSLDSLKNLFKHDYKNHSNDVCFYIESWLQNISSSTFRLRQSYGGLISLISSASLRSQ